MTVNDANNKIYWHLPGFCVYFYLNQVIIHLMKEFPDRFYDGYEIGSVYGTFPGAIWNGGRAVFGITSSSDMKKIIETYNKLGVPVRFTWTNSALEEKHVSDTYCNLIMEIADNGMNQVLVNNPVLEDYLRKTYPDFKYISSTTKRLTKLEDIRRELDMGGSSVHGRGEDGKGQESSNGYYLVVHDYDLNHDESVLTELSPYAGRIEILVDEICFPGCPKRKQHYLEESLAQLHFDKGTPFDCPNKTKKPAFKECMARPAFIDALEVREYYDKWGYANFKLVGRGLPMEMVVDSYMYYLVKDECEREIRDKLNRQLTKLGVSSFERLK